MENLLATLQDWRFAAVTVFIGSWLGHFLFLRTPPPKDSADHLRKMIQARAAGAVAHQLGAAPVELMAKMAGAQSAAALNIGFRQKRRRLLVLALIIAGLGSVFLFVSVPGLQEVPDWVYGLSAALGAYRVWKSW